MRKVVTDSVKIIELWAEPDECNICVTSPADTVAHELKCWTQFFSEVIAGRKTFEIRQEDDRIFNPGDSLLLREYDPKSDSYSGRTWAGSITYKTDWMQKDGVVVLGIKPKSDGTADTVEEVMRLHKKVLSETGWECSTDSPPALKTATDDFRAAVEKLVAERDEAKKAAYGARLLIADVIVDRDRLAAQVEELRKAGLASGTPVAWGYKQGGEFVRFTHLPATGMNGIPLYTAPQITPEDRERAEGVCNRLLAFMTWLPEEDSVVDSDLREAAALLRKAYL